MPETPEVQTLRYQLEAARLKVRNLTVAAMRPGMSPERAELADLAERTARLEVKVRKMALDRHLPKKAPRAAEGASALANRDAGLVGGKAAELTSQRRERSLIAGRMDSIVALLRDSIRLVE